MRRQQRSNVVVNRIQAIRGFNDVLPLETNIWQQTEDKLKNCLKQFSYQEIKLPILESTSLFKRTIGDATDIIEKEMYTFTDLNGDSLSLRPEGTAGCVRAAIENNQLRQTQKWWYLGPMFRHEKPQKGRYRQFYQLGVEAFGFSDPSIDLEMLLMTAEMWKSLGISSHVQLQVNCLGYLEDRVAYKQALVSYFKKHAQQLTAEEIQRLEKNPLRLLDSKSPIIQELLKNAPKLLEYLSEESQQNFKLICQGLEFLQIPFTINPYLVRGLDYYNHLVFEWVTDKLGSQATVCAGGRYDSLVQQLGGPDVPAIGFALGLERLILLLQDQQEQTTADVFILTQEEQPLVRTQQLAQKIRVETGMAVEIHLNSTSLKSQFKKADRSGAAFALVLGIDELNNQQVSVKMLRTDYQQEKQICIREKEVVSWLQQQQGK
ncbi:MAG: histidine--tRNA ligase [Gammaproteobacteria bacterium]|nr:histidine--tRNA ligase [Gammaproteobacteria bacterium]